jgi:hypothetical protein
MDTSKLIAIGIATLLMIGGVAAGSVAAVGGAASADDAGSTADADSPANASDGVGPSDGLPDPVPDRVSEIHETIGSFLNGGIDNLGSALGDLLGSEGSDGDATAGDGDANSNATADGNR